jgi:AAA domain
MLGMNNASDESMELGKFASPTRAADAKIVNIRWLWKGFLPLGTYSGIYGTEGDGKSVFTVWLAAQATLGKLPGHLEGKPTQVVVELRITPTSSILSSLRSQPLRS